MENVSSLKFIPDLVKKMLVALGLNSEVSSVWNEIVAGAICLILAYLLLILTKWILKRVTTRIAKRMKTNIDYILIKNNVFNSLAYLVPAIFLYLVIPITLSGEHAVIIAEKIINLYIIFCVLRSLQFFTTGMNEYYKQKEGGTQKPIQVVFQLVNVISYFIGTLMVISVLIDKPMGGLLAGIGAFMTIIILIFKDTILGFVAGWQLSANDQLRIGDWISVPKYGADGNVEEMSLYCVKVRNWDNTITSIPPYALISDSFQNWRGMQESGGRRIKRSIYVDINSVEFCTDKMLKKYYQIEFLKDYLDKTQQKFANSESAVTQYLPIMAKKQTNLGVFRAYIELLLDRNPEINKELICMVRQLQPTEKGIPLEVYCFTFNKNWEYYENIQSDLFDHILSIASFFDIDLYQLPNKYFIRD
ncbi:MAG: mechanosensitive ion channel domain-containing protein [Bacteroidales bacterium]